MLLAGLGLPSPRQRLIKSPIRRVAEVGIVPHQLEIRVETLVEILVALHQCQYPIAEAKAGKALCND